MSPADIYSIEPSCPKVFPSQGLALKLCQETKCLYLYGAEGNFRGPCLLPQKQSDWVNVVEWTILGKPKM